MSEAHPAQSSRDPVIPDKLYFRIGEVARLLNVEAHTLRFWETEFPQLKVGKGGTGQRLYRRRDVELVVEIKHLLYQQGYTIPGARQFLQNRQRRRSSAPGGTENESASEASRAVPGRSEQQPPLERIRAELRDLSALLDNATPSSNRPLNSSNRDRTRTGTPSRRGLHLAARATPKQPASQADEDNAPRTLPGLFDPDSE